jgi:hypothetical protein
MPTTLDSEELRALFEDIWQLADTAAGTADRHLVGTLLEGAHYILDLINADELVPRNR